MRASMFLLPALLAGILATAQTPVPGTVNRGDTVAQKIAFSADVVTEIKRPLPDGNEINRTLNGKIYRDAEGRVRRDATDVGPNGAESHRSTIMDPVAHKFIVLRLDEKTAIVRPQNSTPGERPFSPNPGVARPKIERLGTQEIEGFTAHGTRVTRTIPAEKMGNEQPIVSVTERWVADELRMPLIEVKDDPRKGHSSMKLQNISKTDPDPALFRIPPDFKVVNKTSGQFDPGEN